MIQCPAVMFLHEGTQDTLRNPFVGIHAGDASRQEEDRRVGALQAVPPVLPLKQGEMGRLLRVACISKTMKYKASLIY